MKFTLIQALRGLAALWVVLFHLEKSDALSGLVAHIPDWLSYSVFGYGSAGVAVFFVLSGFVITHSLANKTMNGREFGRFAVRRSVRLDPPYWISMAVMVAVTAAFSKIHHEQGQYPSAWQLGAHVLYLQELLHVPEIQIVYWTLTYEIQFYLIFAAAMWIGWKRSWVPLYLLALVSAGEGGAWLPQGVFANAWHGFFIGVLAYRAGYRRDAVWPLLLLVAVTLWGRSEASVFAVPVAGTGMLLFVAGRLGKLGTFQSSWWQALGAISYSLYLIHIPTLRLLTGVWQHVAGRSPVADTLALFALVGSCLLAAAVLHWFVERPCHELAKRLFRGASDEATPDRATLATVTPSS